MATTATRPVPVLGERTRSPVAAGVAPALVVGALVLVSLLLRTADLDVGFWIDEGLSVGIADRPPAEIPEVLRLDGSPPLYYIVLHGWMRLFGQGEQATHVLSLVFALLAIPAAFWAGRAIAGTRAGLVAAALTAVNPFLTVYAQETRMYALVVLLGFVAVAGFVLAFVRGRRGHAATFALALAALLYTHNWALFLAAASGLVWLALAVTDRARRAALVRDGVLAFGVVALLYAPWLPTLVFQAAHTGAPWALRPGPVLLLTAFPRLLGSLAVFVLLAALVAAVPMLERERGVLRTSAWVLAALGAGTLAIAWAASQLSPAWATRYLAVALAPLVLLAAIVLARRTTFALAALAAVLVMWATDGPPAAKSNVRDLATVLGPQLRPGDLVISTQPEQIPVLSYYLPGGLRYATLDGPVTDLGVTDWRDGVERLGATDVNAGLRPLLESVPPGGRVLLVEPIFYDLARWQAPWTSLVRLRTAAWRAVTLSDDRFRVVGVTPLLDVPRRPNALRGTMVLRTGAR